MTPTAEQNSDSGNGSGSGSGSGLLARLRGVLPSLPAGPARVGAAILEDPAAVSRMTLRELARATGTSDATVLRLADAIGVDGYRELRLGLAEAVGSMASAGRDGHLTADITRDDPPGRVLAALAEEERAVITDTAACLDPDAVATVADALVAARRAVIVGIGASGLVALDLSAKLERIGLPARGAAEVHQAVTAAVLLGPGDVLVVVSASGSTVDVLEPLRIARERGALTVALTCHPRSAVSAAHHVLMSAPGREQPVRPAAMSSRTGQLFVVDVLFTLVAQRCFDQASEAIADSYQALRHRHGAAAAAPTRHRGPDPDPDPDRNPHQEA
ncbi:MurR/RpiR family transcriptional regulator [Arsenicicoccus sp. oral taxon 190]|uniref:MurR/RpiR family transcriptional regulator n=1 Tax=Arsenicicoccus sp. oral taxon 190 TaxID=1658671 RepID=UPI0009E4E0C2|nr:MurR/RpiR family transcriptional regulator [Arsenicicoccus sp. oral taxon 190]